MSLQSQDQAALVHESRLRVAQSAFEEGHCTICCEEYAGRHALTPCCQRKLCCECVQKAHEGTILPDFLSSGSGGRVIATGSKCPYCTAAWNAPPACVEQQESSGPVSQEQGEENISMHGEGGHYTQLLGAGSTFVDRDCEVASTVALSEAQDGAGNQLFHQDGSLIALDGADVAQSASGELHAIGAASSHEHVGEPGNQLVHQDGMLIAPDGADFVQFVSGELASVAFLAQACQVMLLSRVRHIFCLGQDGPRVSGHRTWMKNKLQQKLELQLVRDNGQTEQGTWSYEASGEYRMVYRLQNCSQGLVAKLNPQGKEKNHNREECKIYETSGDLGGLLPRCYGVATCSIEGENYDIMILDHVAFTVDALLQQQHQEPPNKRTVGLVVFVIWQVVKAAAIVSGPDHEIDCNDWHTQNLAIASVTDEEVTDVRLIDWVGHAKASGKSHRARMTNAVRCFLQYLPDTQRGVDAQWTLIMRNCTDLVLDWWFSGSQRGVVPDLELLLGALERLADPYVTMAGTEPLTSATWVVPTERTQCVACTLSEVTLNTPSCSAPAILQGQPATKAMRSDRTCSSQSRCSHLTLTHVGNQNWYWPRTLTSNLDADEQPRTQTSIPSAAAALRSLTRSALEAQRELVRSGMLHGKKRGPNSYDMATRFWYQYYEHHIPSEAFPEVVFTGLLFKILLEEIEKAGLHDRIDRNQRGEVVKAARDGNNFHGQQGKRFMRSCRPPWTEMSSSQRLRALRYFMWQKFSIDKDKRRKVMCPCPVERWVRAEISWGHRFYMTVVELKVISQAVIDTYERIAPHM